MASSSTFARMFPLFNPTPHLKGTFYAHMNLNIVIVDMWFCWLERSVGKSFLYFAVFMLAVESIRMVCVLCIIFGIQWYDILRQPAVSFITWSYFACWLRLPQSSNFSTTVCVLSGKCENFLSSIDPPTVISTLVLSAPLPPFAFFARKKIFCRLVKNTSHCWARHVTTIDIQNELTITEC